MLKKLEYILLIDDDNATNFINKVIIQKSNLVEKVDIVNDASKGLDLIKANSENQIAQPNLIFLDINMPGLDGWDFIEEYTQLDTQLVSDTVIVMLTTSLNEDDAQKARNTPGIHNFRTKPLSYEMLDELLRFHFPAYF